jgi:hypothetical protein
MNGDRYLLKIQTVELLQDRLEHLLVIDVVERILSD